MARGTAKSDISGTRLAEAIVKSGAYGSGGTTPKGLTPKPTKGSSKSDVFDFTKIKVADVMRDMLTKNAAAKEAAWEASGSGKKGRQALIEAEAALDEFNKGSSKSDLNDRIIKTLLDGVARPVPTKGSSKSDMAQMVTDLDNKATGNVADDRIGTVIKGSSKSDFTANLDRYLKVEGVKVVKDMLKKEAPGASDKVVADAAKKVVNEVKKAVKSGK